MKAIVVLGAVLLGACGGLEANESGSSSADTTAVTAPAICCQFVGETDELTDDAGYAPPAYLVRGCPSLPPGCEYFVGSTDAHCPVSLALGVSQDATCFPAR